MSAQEPTSASGQALTHAHAGAAEQHAPVQQAVSGEFARDFEWGDVDSTSSGFSFSDSETDFSKAVTAGAPYLTLHVMQSSQLSPSSSSTLSSSILPPPSPPTPIASRITPHPSPSLPDLIGVCPIITVDVTPGPIRWCVSSNIPVKRRYRPHFFRRYNIQKASFKIGSSAAADIQLQLPDIWPLHCR
jgi:hypothetical protein